MGLVERARGYARLQGGGVPGGALAAGSYFRPTLVVEADPASEIVRDEVFGPGELRPSSGDSRSAARLTTRTEKSSLVDFSGSRVAS